MSRGNQPKGFYDAENEFNAIKKKQALEASGGSNGSASGGGGGAKSKGKGEPVDAKEEKKEWVPVGKKKLRLMGGVVQARRYIRSRTSTDACQPPPSYLFAIHIQTRHIICCPFSCSFFVRIRAPYFVTYSAITIGDFKVEEWQRLPRQLLQEHIQRVKAPKMILHKAG